MRVKILQSETTALKKGLENRIFFGELGLGRLSVLKKCGFGWEMGSLELGRG
jgi:hypothetical protein